MKFHEISWIFMIGLAGLAGFAGLAGLAGLAGRRMEQRSLTRSMLGEIGG